MKKVRISSFEVRISCWESEYRAVKSPNIVMGVRISFLVKVRISSLKKKVRISCCKKSEYRHRSPNIVLESPIIVLKKSDYRAGKVQISSWESEYRSVKSEYHQIASDTLVLTSPNSYITQICSIYLGDILNVVLAYIFHLIFPRKIAGVTTDILWEKKIIGNEIFFFPRKLFH